MPIITLFFLSLLSLGPFSTAFNHTVDLFGPVDTRPDTWGRAEAYEWHRVFLNVPVGHRVRILRAYGDVVSWPIGKPPDGTQAGILFGLQTTAPEGSARVDIGADNCMLYIQDRVSTSAGARTPFNYDTSVGGLLGPDHTLRVKVAAWLNNTELKIHIEPTFVLIYKFEKENTE